MALRNLALIPSGGIRSIHRSRGTVESPAGQGVGSRAHAPGWPGQEPDRLAGLLPRLAEAPEAALKPGTGGQGGWAGQWDAQAPCRDRGEMYVVVLLTQRQQKAR